MNEQVTAQDGPPPEPPQKRKAGRPPGTPNTALKRTYNAEELAAKVVPVILEGRSLKRHPSLGSISADDRTHLQRITGEAVEVFNERIATKLRDIADLAADRIKAHLEADNFKPGELGFIYSVAHDKRLSLDGSRALNNSAVNVTVNNFGSSPKESLLSELDGMTNVTPITSVIPDVLIDSSSRRQENS